MSTTTTPSECELTFVRMRRLCRTHGVSAGDLDDAVRDCKGQHAFLAIRDGEDDGYALATGEREADEINSGDLDAQLHFLLSEMGEGDLTRHLEWLGVRNAQRPPPAA